MKTAKRRTYTREKREKEIMAAALTVFRKTGYSATRMDDIAAEVGLSKPAIYLYFENKDTLFKAVVKNLAHRNIPQANIVLNTEFSSAEQRLSAMMDLLYDSISPDHLGIFLPLISETASRFPDLAEFFRKDVFERLDSLVIDAINKGVSSGEFRETPASTHAELTVGPALSYGLRRAMFGNSSYDNEELETYKAAHLEMLLAYFKPNQ